MIHKCSEIEDQQLIKARRLWEEKHKEQSHSLKGLNPLDSIYFLKKPDTIVSLGLCFVIRLLHYNQFFPTMAGEKRSHRICVGV